MEKKGSKGWRPVGPPVALHKTRSMCQPKPVVFSPRVFTKNLGKLWECGIVLQFLPILIYNGGPLYLI